MLRFETVRRSLLTRATRVFMGSLLLVAMVPASAGSAEPERSPRRYIPARGVVAYLEYEGLDAHAGAWEATAAYDMMVKTPLGTMFIDLARQLADAWMKEDTLGWLTGADVMAVADVMIHQGFAFAGSTDQDYVTCVLVIKNMRHAGNRRQLDHAWRVLNPPWASFFGAGFLPSRVRGRIVYQLHDGPEPRDGGARPATDPVDPNDFWVSGWLEGNDFILVWDDSCEAGAVPAETARHKQAHAKHINEILDTLEGKQPNLTSHPGFVSALAEGTDLKGFEADGLFFIGPGDDRGLGRCLYELEAGPVTAKTSPHGRAKTDDRKGPGGVVAAGGVHDGLTAEKIEELGFNEIKRTVGRWGFQDKALVADVRIEAPAPRKGAIACLDQPAFRTDRLPSLPAGVGTFLVGSIGFDGTSQRVADVLKLVDPDSIKELDALEKQFHEIGLRLREDVLQPLGPTWFLLDVPPAKPGESRRNRPGLRDHVLVATIKDADKVGKILDKMLADDGIIRCGSLEIRDKDKRVLAGPSPSFEPLPKPDRGYRFTSLTALTDRRGEKVQPTVLIGRSVVVLAWDVEQGRRVVADLDKAERWKPTGELAHALEVLPRELTFLSVMDNGATSVPDQLADLPRIIQTLINQSSEPDLENASIWSLLDVFGAPRPGGLGIRVDRSKRPDPDRIRRGLFPSVLAIASDDRGFRIIGREPLPFVAIAGEASYHYSWTAGWRGFLPHFEESVSLTFPRFDWDD